MKWSKKQVEAIKEVIDLSKDAINIDMFNRGRMVVMRSKKKIPDTTENLVKVLHTSMCLKRSVFCKYFKDNDCKDCPYAIFSEGMTTTSEIFIPELLRRIGHQVLLYTEIREKIDSKLLILFMNQDWLSWNQIESTIVGALIDVQQFWELVLNFGK